MTDVHSSTKRSYNMSRIRNSHTGPEKAVRSLLHRSGYRFRLHAKDLPGKPDIVFRRMRKVIFVHGCFWHMHSCPNGQVTPETNSEFWKEKREANVERDKRNEENLRESGWGVAIVWECEIKKDKKKLLKRLEAFLE